MTEPYQRGIMTKPKELDELLQHKQDTTTHRSELFDHNPLLHAMPDEDINEDEDEPETGNDEDVDDNAEPGHDEKNYIKRSDDTDRIRKNNFDRTPAGAQILTLPGANDIFQFQLNAMNQFMGTWFAILDDLTRPRMQDATPRKRQ
jgi:hypothetical protein